MDRWVDLSTGEDTATLSVGWKNVRLRSVIQFLDQAEKVDATKSYPLAGVRLDGAGVYHRETVRGTETSATYLTRLQPGALIYSRLFAWRGAFAVVRDEQAALWCSNEFPQFVCDAAELTSEYLCLWALSSATLRSVEKRSVGTSAVSRNRFKEREFLELDIALPPLSSQQAIVSQWQKHQTDVTAARERAESLEAEARAAFLVGLGLREPASVTTHKAFAIDFARLGRWGVAQVRESLVGPDPSVGKFPVVRLGDVIADLENGWSPKCHPRPATPEEWGVLKLGAVSYGTFDETANKALPKNFKPRPDLEVRIGDVLFVRGNVLNLVGACTHVEKTRPKLMMPDLIFRAIFRDNSPIVPAYLAEVMRTTYLRRQIEDAATGTSPTMKKLTKPSLLALRFPLPPLATQHALIAAMSATRAEAARERATADKLSKSAANELESALLGSSNRTVPH